MELGIAKMLLMGRTRDILLAMLIEPAIVD